MGVNSKKLTVVKNIPNGIIDGEHRNRIYYRKS